MLEGIVPQPFLLLLAAFEPCFAAPSYRNFRVLVAGWVHCPGRRSSLHLGRLGLRHLHHARAHRPPPRPERLRHPSAPAPAPHPFRPPAWLPEQLLLYNAWSRQQPGGHAEGLWPGLDYLLPNADCGRCSTAMRIAVRIPSPLSHSTSHLPSLAARRQLRAAGSPALDSGRCSNDPMGGVRRHG
jgi:hypothetical protein